MGDVAFQAISQVSVDTDQLHTSGGISPTISFATNPQFNSNIVVESGFEIQFHNPADTFYTSIKAGAQLSTINLTLPLTAPSIGQALISLDGAPGNLGWGSVTTSTAPSIVGGVAFFLDTSGTLIGCNNSSFFLWDDNFNNFAAGAYATFSSSAGCAINGGSSSIIDTGQNCYIIGGSSNQVQNAHQAGIIGGLANLTTADNSICIGGVSNTVSGVSSYGLGFKSLVSNNYSFVFSDHHDLSTGLQTTAEGQFLVQSTGGFGFVSGNINLTSFPNNFINIYSDLVDIRAKLQYKNNVGTVSTTILDVLQVKGDLYTFNSTINDRLGVGTNGQILSANSGTTTGLEWINNATGSVTSISAGSNIVCTPNPIVSTGTVALSNTPSGLTSLGVGNFTISSSTISSAVASIGLSSVDGRIIVPNAGANPGVALFFNAGGFYASIGASSSTVANLSFTLPGTHITNGLLFNTGGGVLEETITPSGLTSLGVGSLLLVGGTVRGSNGVLIESTASGQSIGLSPKGATQVRIFSQDASNAIPLRFYNAANTQYVEFKAGTLSGNTTWTWPTADAAGVMVSDGSGNLSLTASPSLTTATLTGAALTEHDYTANSGSSITIDPANGHSQGITLNSATPTLTLASNPSSGNVKEMTVDIIQDGTGGRNPTWANVTWAAGSAPTINQTAGAVTYLTFKGTTRGWIGFAANSNIINYGTYTPTLTNTANLSASTAYPCQYMQVGTVVTVSGRVDVDPTTITTLTQLKISLPVSSNFTQSYQCGGCGGAAGTSVEAYGITAAPSDTNALMSWVAVDVTNHQVAFSFTYQVV
jgi:hypothetical protein